MGWPLIIAFSCGVTQFAALYNKNRVLLDLCSHSIGGRGMVKRGGRIAQFRSIKIQRITIDLSMRLWGITTEFVGFIPQSLVPRSIVQG